MKTSKIKAKAVGIAILATLLFNMGCFAFYELIINAISIVRPVFGLKMNSNTRPVAINSVVN
jgi:hypothetical protein